MGKATEQGAKKDGVEERGIFVVPRERAGKIAVWRGGEGHLCAIKSKDRGLFVCDIIHSPDCKGLHPTFTQSHAGADGDGQKIDDSRLNSYVVLLGE